MMNATVAQHTPGPWTCKVGVMEGSKTQIIQPHYVVNQTEKFACPAISRDEANANARLIAAAPELLYALRELSRAWDATQLPCSERIENALYDADAAIAKAEGLL